MAPVYRALFPTLFAAFSFLGIGCERTGPCAQYDRMAENRKSGAYVRYCVDRKGRAVGPYLCEREDGLGKVTGQFREARRQGVWKFFADGGALIRQEMWRDDEKQSSSDFEVELPPLPEELKAVRCDGYLIRRAELNR